MALFLLHVVIAYFDARIKFWFHRSTLIQQQYLCQWLTSSTPFICSCVRFLLNIIKYIFGFSFVMGRCFFFTRLSHTSTPVSRFRFIDLDPAAVFVPVAYFFDTFVDTSMLHYVTFCRSYDYYKDINKIHFPNLVCNRAE